MPPVGKIEEKSSLGNVSCKNSLNLWRVEHFYWGFDSVFHFENFFIMMFIMAT